jgi:hypothetical protein
VVLVMALAVVLLISRDRQAADSGGQNKDQTKYEFARGMRSGSNQ